MDSPGKYGGNPGKVRAEMSSKKDAGKQDCTNGTQSGLLQMWKRKRKRT